MALIKTTAELKKYVAVQQNTEIKSILPDLERAEDAFIVPHLGWAQYSELLAAYGSSTLLTPALGFLLERVQAALANLALAQYADIGQVAISDAGFQINVQDAVKTAFAWQIEGVKGYFLRNGYNALEKLLRFLEENRAAYPLWVNSEAYTIFKSHLINSSSEFSGYCDIGDSRRTFLALRPIMRTVEQLTVAPQITPGLYAQVLDEIRTGAALSEPAGTLLELLRPAVAHLVIAEAIPVLPLEITAGGVVVNELLTAEGMAKRLAPGSMLQERKAQAHATGMRYLASAVEYLKASATESRYKSFYDANRPRPTIPPTANIYGAF